MFILLFSLPITIDYRFYLINISQIHYFPSILDPQVQASADSIPFEG